MRSLSCTKIKRAVPWRACVGLSVAGLLILWACATDQVSFFLVRTLEQNYPPAVISMVEPADAIVVLGGGTVIPADAWAISSRKPGTSRYLYAARLFHAGKAPTVVVVGGPAAPNNAISALSSDEIADFLVDAGLPRYAIVKAPDSATTAQGALCTKPIIRARSFRRVLLITSALHMSRAAAIFRAAGIDVVPVSSDAESAIPLSPAFPDLRPNVMALRRTGRVLHEYVGLLVYPLQVEFARSRMECSSSSAGDD